jgi:hypothetical protein
VNLQEPEFLRGDICSWEKGHVVGGVGYNPDQCVFKEGSRFELKELPTNAYVNSRPFASENTEPIHF